MHACSAMKMQKLRGNAASLLKSPAARNAARTRAVRVQAMAASPTRLGAPVGGLNLVPAYKGLAVPLHKGRTLKVINTHGQQVCRASRVRQLERAKGHSGPLYLALSRGLPRSATSGASPRATRGPTACCAPSCQVRKARSRPGAH